MKLLSAATLLITVSVAAAGTEIPEHFRSRNPHRKAPLWISARVALDRDILRAGALAEHENAALRKHVRGAAARRSVAAVQTTVTGKCEITFGALFDDAPMPASSTLDDVRRYASAHLVVEGVVVGSDIGLYAATPFTVVQVRVTHASKAGAPRTAYLLFPKGTLAVDGVTLCTSDPRYGEVPIAGDKLLFIAGTSVDADGTLFRLPAEHIFVSHDGTVAAARRLRAEIQDATLAELRELIERPAPATR